MSDPGIWAVENVCIWGFWGIFSTRDYPEKFALNGFQQTSCVTKCRGAPGQRFAHFLQPTRHLRHGQSVV